MQTESELKQQIENLKAIVKSKDVKDYFRLAILSEINNLEIKLEKSKKYK